MKIKKYSANSLPEAMKLVRSDLGSEAVILNTREVQKGGFLGFFTKKSIEVFAGLDQDVAFEQVKRETPPIKREVLIEKEQDAQLTQEIRQLKKMVQSLGTHASETKQREPFIEEWRSFLIDQEIDSSITEELIMTMTKKFESLDEDEKDQTDWHKWMTDWLGARMKKSDFGGFHYETKFLNLIGPTGVGKTTTIAKIGAKAVLKDGKKVAFITTDTYRIAAIEQLKTYAEILNVPCEVAYTADDFRKAKEKFNNYDLVLVDSAGRNFLNRFYVEELQQILNFDEDMKNYLVLSLTSKYRDMEKIYRQFNSLPIDKVIFTKRDETASFGSMINLAVQEGVSIAYITNGQNVPDDMYEADADQLIEMLLKEYVHHD
jgi:flagellar biosynthesis protein FlhF